MYRFPLVSIILTVAITLSVFHEASCGSISIKPCRPCINDCDDNPPDECPWGESRDDCGRRVCSKGPGERCGGYSNAFGSCGEGLTCRPYDEKCHGCSLITLDCF
ncbi:neuroparsin-A [Aethina tumida]|uniref:neuroparsin-A n=1 Tax=Aethina tumida TaxID=116153 RepID=UPI00096B0D8D|nr:neuroparsin-A [Aethina tumida]